MSQAGQIETIIQKPNESNTLELQAWNLFTDEMFEYMISLKIRL